MQLRGSEVLWSDHPVTHLPVLQRSTVVKVFTYRGHPESETEIRWTRRNPMLKGGFEKERWIL